MALRGTLKDFGIADILQLIGHQGKSGQLTVKNGDQQVDIWFLDGAVMRADTSNRDKRDLLGRLLVRAEVLAEDQLTRALDTQKRTLKRLGQILVESGAIDKKVLASFTRLQTTETIYRLFFWNSGTYEFTQRDIIGDTEFEPIKSESILMEGFRQLDEWPSIRRRVTSYGLVLERIRELDPLVAQSSADDLGIDDAFGEGGGAGGDASLKNIGQNERMVYQLVDSERDVQKVIDLSRLGEFETCKAIERLLEAGFIQPMPQEVRRPSAEATVGGISVRTRGRWLPVATRAGLSLALLAALAVGARLVDPRWLDLVGLRQPWGFVDTTLQSQLAVAHLQKLDQALAVFEAANGTYPEHLDDLVDAKLVTARDLRYPFQQPYWYRREGNTYQLLRPLY
jgi:hypothetical protein